MLPEESLIKAKLFRNHLLSGDSLPLHIEIKFQLKALQ